VTKIEDNVRAELEFLAEHPGTQIRRQSPDVAAGLTIRYTGTLPDADGGGQAQAADLGDLLGRMRQMAGEHEHASASSGAPPVAG
jgi:hypothetical protein